MDGPGTFIPVQSKRVHRANFTLELAKELPAVFTVFTAAASALQGEHDAMGYALAAAEVIAGAAVLVVIALEARHLFGSHTGKSHSPRKTPRVDASSLAAAALGYVEAWHHAHVVGHFKLVSPAVLGATVALLLAVLNRRVPSARGVRRRRHVGITPSGISFAASRRNKWRADWSDVAAVEHDHGELAIRLHDGQRHSLRADDHLDGESLLAETRAAIAVHAPHIPGAVA